MKPVYNLDYEQHKRWSQSVGISMGLIVAVVALILALATELHLLLSSGIAVSVAVVALYTGLIRWPATFIYRKVFSQK